MSVLVLDSQTPLAAASRQLHALIQQRALRRDMEPRDGRGVEHATKAVLRDLARDQRSGISNSGRESTRIDHVAQSSDRDRCNREALCVQDR